MTVRKVARSSSKKKSSKFVFKLFVTGNSPHSMRAILNIKRICEEDLEGHYKLEVIDIYKDPFVAKQQQIIAAPTLLKLSPLPAKRFIGDLSDSSKILSELGIRPKKNKGIKLEKI